MGERRAVTPRVRIALALLCLALLGIGGWWLGTRLQFGGDLRKFMTALGRPRRRLNGGAARAAGIDDARMRGSCPAQTLA